MDAPTASGEITCRPAEIAVTDGGGRLARLASILRNLSDFDRHLFGSPSVDGDEVGAHEAARLAARLGVVSVAVLVEILVGKYHEREAYTTDVSLLLDTGLGMLTTFSCVALEFYANGVSPRVRMVLCADVVEKLRGDGYDASIVESHVSGRRPFFNIVPPRVRARAAAHNHCAVQVAAIRCGKL